MEFRDLFNYGVPTGILLLLLFAGWRLLDWTKHEIVVPVVKAHLTLVATLQDHVPKQTDAINELTTANIKTTAALESNAQATRLNTEYLWQCFLWK